MIDISRQAEIFDPSNMGWPLTVIGLGNAGNAAAFAALCAGVEDMVVIDGDRTETQNIPTQVAFRGTSDIGAYKVDAFVEFARRQEFTTKITPRRRNVGPNTKLEGIVISGVDSMRSRRRIWSAVKDNPLIPFFMDIRVGGDGFSLLTLDPNDEASSKRYESSLISSRYVQPLPCGGRSFTGTSFALAGYVMTELAQFVKLGELPREFLHKESLRKEVEKPVQRTLAA